MNVGFAPATPFSSGADVGGHGHDRVTHDRICHDWPPSDDGVHHAHA